MFKVSHCEPEAQPAAFLLKLSLSMLSRFLSQSRLYPPQMQIESPSTQLPCSCLPSLRLGAADQESLPILYWNTSDVEFPFAFSIRPPVIQTNVSLKLIRQGLALLLKIGAVFFVNSGNALYISLHKSQTPSFPSCAQIKILRPYLTKFFKQRFS